MAGATLAVAALFQPARRRIQAVVDRTAAWGRTDPIQDLGNAFLAAAAVALLGVTARRLRREHS